MIKKVTATTAAESNTSSLAAITRQIHRAERDLIESRTQLDDDDGMAVLFTGNHHDAFPRHLVVNPDLSPQDKLAWQVIRLAINDPNKPGAIPRRDDIATMMACSAPTVTNARSMLRIQRWMTFCKSVRRSGRFVGDIFLLHDEPLSLQSTLELDPTYVSFLESQLQNTNQKLKRAAAKALTDIEVMASGLPPTEVEQLGIRITRALDDPQHSHRRKNLSPVDGANNNDSEATIEESSTSEHQSKDFAPVENHQGKNLSPVEESKNFAPVKKEIFYSPGSSSSFINNKYITTARARDNDVPENPTAGLTGLARNSTSEKSRAEAESLANFLEIQRFGRHGLEPEDEARWFRKYIPWWGYPPFERYILMLYAGRANVLPGLYRKIKPLENHQQTLVTMQLLGRTAAFVHGWADSIRDPIAYIHKLITLATRNELVPDDWALEFMRCYEESTIPKFLDSPEILERRRLEAANNAGLTQQSDTGIDPEFEEIMTQMKNSLEGNQG